MRFFTLSQALDNDVIREEFLDEVLTIKFPDPEDIADSPIESFDISALSLAEIREILVNLNILTIL